MCPCRGAACVRRSPARPWRVPARPACAARGVGRDLEGVGGAVGGEGDDEAVQHLGGGDNGGDDLGEEAEEDHGLRDELGARAEVVFEDAGELDAALEAAVARDARDGVGEECGGEGGRDEHDDEDDGGYHPA